MSCVFEDNQAVLNKVREKGFSNEQMDVSHQLKCQCGNDVEMSTFETKCENCGGVFAVTPCSQEDAGNIVFVK